MSLITKSDPSCIPNGSAMVMVFIDGSRRDSEEFAFRPRRLCDSAVVPGELRKWTVLTGIITSREKGWYQLNKPTLLGRFIHDIMTVTVPFSVDIFTALQTANKVRLYVSAIEARRGNGPKPRQLLLRRLIPIYTIAVLD